MTQNVYFGRRGLICIGDAVFTADMVFSARRSVCLLGCCFCVQVKQIFLPEMTARGLVFRGVDLT